MTTPESRRAQADRKSSFLDNIGERAEFEEKRREGQLRKKKRVQGRGEKGRGGRGGKVVKKKTSVTAKKTVVR